LPVVGGLAYAAYSEYLKHRREIAALRSSGNEGEVEQLRERIRKLERRVETLEAIVTSPEFQMFQERMRQIQAEAKKSLPPNQQQLTLPPQQENQR
jgi:cell fate (sporulation/competence/biofilm development) regulator YlbF (YheA/YmcA/DUF963 family)